MKLEDYDIKFPESFTEDQKRLTIDYWKGYVCTEPIQSDELHKQEEYRETTTEIINSILRAIGYILLACYVYAVQVTNNNSK